MLLFTDPPAPADPAMDSLRDGLEIRREPSGGAAGVAFDDSGRLLVAERAPAT